MHMVVACSPGQMPSHSARLNGGWRNFLGSYHWVECTSIKVEQRSGHAQENRRRKLG